MSRDRYGVVDPAGRQSLTKWPKYPRAARSAARPRRTSDGFVGQANRASRAIATRPASMARAGLPTAARSRLMSRISSRASGSAAAAGAGVGVGPGFGVGVGLGVGFGVGAGAGAARRTPVAAYRTATP